MTVTREMIEEAGGIEAAEEFTDWLWEVANEARTPSPRWFFTDTPENGREIRAETCYPAPLLMGQSGAEATFRALEGVGGAYCMFGRSTFVELVAPEQVDEWDAREDRLWLTANEDADPTRCLVYLVTAHREIAERVVAAKYPDYDTPRFRTYAEAVCGDNINRLRAVHNWERREDHITAPGVNEYGKTLGAAMGSRSAAMSKVRWMEP